MKFKKGIVAIAVVSILLGSLCIGMGLVFGGSLNSLRISLGFGSHGLQFYQYGSSEKENLTLSDIDSLTISISMGSVEFVEADEDEIRVMDVLKDQYKLDIKGKEAVLDLKSKYPIRLFDFGSQDSQNIRVLVPKGFKFQYLEIHNSMGEITLQDTQAKMLRIEANMGDIEGRNIKTEGLNIQNDMGDIDMEGVFLNTTIIDDSMGDIDIRILDDINKYSYDAHCSMGSVIVNHEKGRSSQRVESANDIRITNSMGDITLNFNR